MKPGLRIRMVQENKNRLILWHPIYSFDAPIQIIHRLWKSGYLKKQVFQFNIETYVWSIISITIRYLSTLHLEMTLREKSEIGWIPPPPLNTPLKLRYHAFLLTLHGVKKSSKWFSSDVYWIVNAIHQLSVSGITVQCKEYNEWWMYITKKDI